MQREGRVFFFVVVVVVVVEYNLLFVFTITINSLAHSTGCVGSWKGRVKQVETLLLSEVYQLSIPV